MLREILALIMRSLQIATFQPITPTNANADAEPYNAR